MTILLTKIDALLITDPINIRYLTGFVGVSPDEREVYCLLSKDILYLFTNALYLEAAKNAKCPMLNAKLEVVEISRENPLSKKLVNILKEKKIKRLGFEEIDLTVAEYQKLKLTLKGVSLVPTRNRVEELRMIKRVDEIENIRQAAALTDQCFIYLTSFLKPSVTESQIAWEIESFFRKHGAKSVFSPIVAFGTHSSQPHYTFGLERPGLSRLKGQALKNQDIVLLDFGARVNGYCSDMTRVVFVGRSKDEWKRAYDTVLRAQQTALDLLAGFHPVSGATLDKGAREAIKKAGFPLYPHSLGHGVGLSIHEQPRLSYKNPTVHLKPGMVVTVEPAIYIEGSYGIRIEDLVLLKKDGVEILSKSPKELILL